MTVESELSGRGIGVPTRHSLCLQFSVHNTCWVKTNSPSAHLDGRIDIVSS